MYADATLAVAKNLAVSVSAIAHSRGFVDPTNKTWSSGYALLGARVSRSWRHKAAYWTFFFTGRNLTAKRFIAFTEPDPDGNSYQPCAGREVFGGVQVRF